MPGKLRVCVAVHQQLPRAALAFSCALRHKLQGADDAPRALRSSCFLVRQHPTQDRSACRWQGVDVERASGVSICTFVLVHQGNSVPSKVRMLRGPRQSERNCCEQIAGRITPAENV
jgi:hypothetical protein